MNVIVAMKQVPDLGAGIELDEQGTGLARDRLGFVTSPFDEWALELIRARQQRSLREGFGDSCGRRERGDLDEPGERRGAARWAVRRP